MNKARQVVIALATVLVGYGACSDAIVPPSSDGKLPDAYYQRVKQDQGAFTFTHAFIDLVQKIRANRQALLQSHDPQLALSVGEAAGGFAVTGEKAIPVLPILTSDPTTSPYSSALFQTEFFDGPWPTRTLTEFYQEMSYGRFRLTGTVYDWKSVPKSQSYYAGEDYTDANGNKQHCFGICPTGKDRIEEFVRTHWNSFLSNGHSTTTMGQSGKQTRATMIAMSTFWLSFIPGIGGECTKVKGNTNIWSHAGHLRQEYVTRSQSKSGGYIRVKDYLVVPTLACDGTSSQSA